MLLLMLSLLLLLRPCSSRSMSLWRLFMTRKYATSSPIESSWRELKARYTIVHARLLQSEMCRTAVIATLHMRGEVDTRDPDVRCVDFVRFVPFRTRSDLERFGT